MPGAMAGGAEDVLESLRVEHAKQGLHDALSLDPGCSFWKPANPVQLDRDAYGRKVPLPHRTEVRSRWTETHISFLFVSHFHEVWCRPGPVTDQETPELWNWDVAEVFLQPPGWAMHRYREFQISPQGEWLDVDVDLSDPPHERGWVWQSGMECRASINWLQHTWAGVMRIPMSSLATPEPQAGMAFRANFFRTEGPASRSVALAWRPPMSPTFHQPAVFGTLLLA